MVSYSGENLERVHQHTSKTGSYSGVLLIRSIGSFHSVQFLYSNFIFRYQQNAHTQYNMSVAYPRGGFGCSNPPPRNSEGPPKNRAKLNATVKTVKKNC